MQGKWVDEKGRTYIAILKDCTKRQALTRANKHFKTKISDLHVVSGRITDDGELEIGYGIKGNVWVVSRKELLK